MTQEQQTILNEFYKKSSKELELMTEEEYKHICDLNNEVLASNFKNFVKDLPQDIIFYRNGLRVYKWELYASGCNETNYKDRLFQLRVKTDFDANVSAEMKLNSKGKLVNK
jgi:aspartyl/asparaginyl-tRNA synthetase